MAQRGVGRRGIEHIGTQVEGGYLVRESDFQAFDRELRRLRDEARRLVGKRVVIKEDVVVTVYQRA
jgi:hypothetical protein